MLSWNLKVGKYCSTAESVKIKNDKVVKKESRQKVEYFTVRGAGLPDSLQYYITSKK